MNKSQLAYLSGITFVSIGLIPISRSIFSIELFNDSPVFFLAGGIWLLLIIIFLYSSKESQRQFPTRGDSQQKPQLLSLFGDCSSNPFEISLRITAIKSKEIKVFPVTRALRRNVFHCMNNYGLNLFFSCFPPCLALFSHIAINVLNVPF